jgi:hypothetical protein
MRDYFESAMREILGNGKKVRISTFVNQREWKKMLNEHVLGKRNYTEEIDSILTLSLIGKLFFSP